MHKPFQYCLGLLVCFSAGCGREEIRVYRVEKEHAAVTHHNHQHDHQPATVVPTLKWKTPAGWEEQPASEFRRASFKMTGKEGKLADVSVIPLPGGAGGELGNVNRWRGQVGLEAITEDDLKKLAEPVAMAGPPTTLYDLAGPTMRILAAIQVRDGTTWFYKMTGDTALVGEQKPAFVEFLKSLEFVTASAWPAPAGWQQVEAGQFLVAKFVVGEGTTVNVSSSAGDGGGLAANVNRWRQQLGLEEVATPATQPLGAGQLVELAGKSAALVAVIVPRGGQTWFFKLMGDAQTVAAQKEAFVKFVQEAKF